jgi:hypothetical protein
MIGNRQMKHLKYFFRRMDFDAQLQQDFPLLNVIIKVHMPNKKGIENQFA